MTYILRDCIENNCVYKILHFTDDTISRDDIDNMINKIKNSIHNQGWVAWTIDDILEILGCAYDFKIFNFDGYLDI